MTFTPTKSLSDFWSIADRLRDVASVRQVFGDPVERGSVTVIPVATVLGGGGGGTGTGAETEGATDGQGTGGGLGIMARPVGAFVLHDDSVTFEPARDYGRMVLGATLVGALAVLAVG